MVLDGEGANSLNVFLYVKPLSMKREKNRKLSVTRSIMSIVYSEYSDCSLLT